MLTEAQILAMDADELTDALKAAVTRGCRKLLKKDLVMLAIGAHEQSICHRLAVYLERFADLNVDCEYNRQKVHPKSIRSRHIKPDILIHKRMDNRFNLMVLEAKAGAQTSTRDKQKLTEMLRVRGMYHYTLGVYLHVENKRARVLKSKKVMISLRWHGDPDNVVTMEKKIPPAILETIARQPE
ncbi:hypothetical protein MXD81_31385 [Microbacteriaceae bacterium K1510]|nr:hypothetical protein [Microbacteriaceae bacterium K1510]